MENRRQHKRYDAEVAAEIEIDGEVWEGETHDISAGGASAAFGVEVTDGATVALTLILTQDGIEDPNQEPFEAPATIMWSAPTDEGETMVGLRFGELKGAQATRLQQFLAALEG